jgi:putative transposase
VVKREFEADAPNTLWIADMAYVPTWAGFIYLAVVLDVWSRRVVGWADGRAHDGRSRAGGAEHGFGATQTRGRRHPPQRPGQPVHEHRLRRALQEDGRASLDGHGRQPEDNAMAESFFASLECELIDRRSFKTKTEARLALFTWIEGWYNPRRRHSGLGQVSPANFGKETQRKSPHAITER